MAQTIQIPVAGQDSNPVTFPQRCACCGQPNQAESTLTLHRLVMRGARQKDVTLKYQIPHCSACARSTQAVFLAGFIPFVLGVLVIGGITFVAVTLWAGALGLDNYGQTANANSLIAGGAAGLLVGLIGGFLFEVAARVVLLPIFGQALFRAPLLAAQFLTDADYVAGVTGKLDPGATHAHLTFANDDIAREFRTINHLG